MFNVVVFNDKSFFTIITVEVVMPRVNLHVSAKCRVTEERFFTSPAHVAAFIVCS